MGGAANLPQGQRPSLLVQAQVQHILSSCILFFLPRQYVLRGAFQQLHSHLHVSNKLSSVRLQHQEPQRQAQTGLNTPPRTRQSARFGKPSHRRPRGPPFSGWVPHRTRRPQGHQAAPSPGSELVLSPCSVTCDLQTPHPGQRPPHPSRPPPPRPQRGRGPDSEVHYQVPVNAAEECVSLDVREPGLRPAAKPLFGVLGVRVQMRTRQPEQRRPTHRRARPKGRLPTPRRCTPQRL